MDIRSFRIIESVARLRSFSRAGQDVFLSTAAVSAAVIKAEAQVGLPLFDRTTRSVCPTPLLERLLPRIRLLLKDYDGLLADIGETVKHRTGHVTIGCLSSIAVRILPRAIARCRERYPGVTIALRDAAAAAVYEDVALGRTDFALVSAYAGGSELELLPLLDDPLVLICPAAHPLAVGGQADIAALKLHDFVLLSQETGVRAALDQAIGPMAEKFRVKHEVTQISSLIGMVREGLGVSFVPLLGLPQGGDADLAIVPTPGLQLSRSIGILKRTDRPPTPAGLAAMECVGNILEMCAADA